MKDTILNVLELSGIIIAFAIASAPVWFAVAVIYSLAQLPR